MTKAARTAAYISRLTAACSAVGTIRMPTPAATLSQAVFMVVGKKNARYSSTLLSDPSWSFNLAQEEDLCYQLMA